MTDFQNNIYRENNMRMTFVLNEQNYWIILRLIQKYHLIKAEGFEDFAFLA